MTDQKQVLAWAREVWGDDSGKPWSEQSINHLTAFADLIEQAVRADERERCAKEADYYSANSSTARNIAAAIRARGQA